MLRTAKIVIPILIVAGLLSGMGGDPSGRSTAATTTTSTPSEPPELAYLKQVNAFRPPEDPQLLLLLMSQFANAHRHNEGIAYIDGLRRRFDAQLTDAQKALYLVAIASLRAGRADEVFLLRRIGWIKDTLRQLDEAKRLTHDEGFVSRWMSGVVRTQLPGFFNEADAALADLVWCEQNAARAPHPGWLREVYYQLGSLYQRRGDAARAQRYRQASGLTEDHKPAYFTTAFAEDAQGGHMFSARRIREVIPATVYVLSGFEFTEYTFIVSADRRELISIDAGTRPDSARAAYEALRARVPGLPPLTTVFVTHAHWDHVGGHTYFRSLAPTVKFYGRENYAEEVQRGLNAPAQMATRFFGQSFDPETVRSYRPDQTVDKPLRLTIGGTRFDLLPTRGGETDDAMLIHMPQHGVVFMGDIVMPYLGAPFLAEGSLDGLVAAIDQVNQLKPTILLHGHEPLTQIFTSTAMLADLRGHLLWLQAQVRDAMREGMERGAIHALNLIPPALADSPSNVHLAYLVMRENAINRLYAQTSGYWQRDLTGLDALTNADRAALLVDYLHLTDAEIAAAAQHMVAEGRHELSAALLRWAEPRFPDSARLADARRLTYLKLMEKYQEFNPFKFILYSAEIGQRTPQITPP